MCAELSAHMTVYARLGLRNLLSVENFSALAPAYAKLRQRNLLPEINFSALATAYRLAWTEILSIICLIF